MSDQRGVTCSGCGFEHISGELDPDDFDADLINLGWIVPDEGMRWEGGIYNCPSCKLKRQNK